LVAEWLRSTNLPVLRPIDTIPEGWLYYNNFELASPRWFLESYYWQMYKMVDSAGGIYTDRWGDHVIHSLGLNLFMKDEQKIELDCVRYRHQGFEA
jgi:glycosyl transferase family 15 (putative glycolipid 2-alpha-mannosyltransferase)